MRTHLLLVAICVLAAGTGLCAPPEKAVALQAVDRMDLPCEIDKLSPIAAPEVSMAVGEYEPLAVLVTATAAIENEKFRIRGLPSHIAVETRIATPYKRKLRGSPEVTQPFLLEVSPSVAFKEPGKAVYWLTFHAEQDAKPGRRDVVIRLGNASTKVRLTIHPYRLRRDPNFFFGAFCGGKDSNITPAHMKDLHERGFDALQFFWGGLTLPIRNDGGRMSVDFSSVDRWMRDFQKAGMKGPVVWSLGNYRTSHTVNVLSQVFGIPRPEPIVRNKVTLTFADVKNPELNRRLKELMLAIKDRAAAEKWPEISFLIYDEATMALMEEHENRYKFIKSFWPDLRIYGVTMDKIKNAEAINHMVDILVANGDFEKIGALAEKSGKPFWLYGSASGMNEVYLRRRYAWTAWARDAKASWIWAYNYHAGNPYDDFDSTGPDSTMSMLWPPRTPDGPLVYSVSWDGMREAVDDLAYIQTLEWMLGQSKSPRAPEMRAKLAEMKNTLPAGKGIAEARQSIAGWIEELLRSEKGLYSEIRVK